MALSKDLLGQKFQAFKYHIERGKVKEFCRAIGETNPIYLDPAEAKKHGYEDTPIPPTFQTTFTFWGYEKFWDDLRGMGIDTGRLLHMKEEYTYLKPVYPGMTLTCQSEVIDVKTGKMDMLTMKGIYANEKGESCIEAEMAIVMRPEGT